MRLCLNETWDINGAKQFIAIRAERPNLPLLLYLHGGPGDAALPLVLRYNRALADHFTLAIWEQRGAGKSYYPFAPGEHITIGTFVQDAQALIQLLLERFHQEKLYLVGHSWGSVIGLKLCSLCPGLIHHYIGCGQVVDMRRACRLAYEFALSHAGGKAAERLKRIDPAYLGETWLDDLLFTTGQVVKHGGSLYGASNYNKLVFPFLWSREYSLRDLIHRQKGALQSIQALWQELMDVNFSNVTAYDVPVTLIEGKHDYHVSSALARAYRETITSPTQFHLFEHACHFPQWSQPDGFHAILTALQEGR